MSVFYMLCHYQCIYLIIVILYMYTGVTSGTGTAYPSGAHGFTPRSEWVCCCSVFYFLCSVLLSCDHCVVSPSIYGF